MALLKAKESHLVATQVTSSSELKLSPNRLLGIFLEFLQDKAGPVTCCDEKAEVALPPNLPPGSYLEFLPCLPSGIEYDLRVVR